MSSAHQPDTLAQLLGNLTRARVLEHLFAHPSKAFGIRETAALAGGLEYRATRRELLCLRELGFVRTVGEGRNKKFALEPGHPAHDEMRGLVLKTGVHGSLRLLREEMARHDWIQAAVLFGSLAAGGETPDSDVDLLVIGDGSDAEFIPVADRLRTTLGRTIDFFVYTRAELRDQLAQPDGFVGCVLASHHVMLKGAPLIDSRRPGPLGKAEA